jgi:hypothetical protein
VHTRICSRGASRERAQTPTWLQYRAASAARMSAEPGARRATRCISAVAPPSSPSCASARAAFDAAKTAPAVRKRGADQTAGLQITHWLLLVARASSKGCAEGRRRRGAQC